MQVFMYVILGTQELETKVKLASLALYLQLSQGLSLYAAGTMTTYICGWPECHNHTGWHCIGMGHGTQFNSRDLMPNTHCTMITLFQQQCTDVSQSQV